MLLSRPNLHRVMKLTNRKHTFLAGLSIVAAPSELFVRSFVPNAQHAFLGAAPTPGRSYSTATACFQSKSSNSSPVATWTYDKPCTEMPWNSLPSAIISIVDKKEMDADLVVVGVFAPKKDDNDDEDKETEEPTVSLSGAVKELDEALGGALSTSMLENAKSFQHGAEAGSTTPAIRVFQDGKYKRYVVMGMGIDPSDSDDNDSSQSVASLAGIGFKVGTALASTCDAEKVKTAQIMLPGEIGSHAILLQALSTSFYSKLYKDIRFRTDKKVTSPAEDLESLSLVAAEGAVSKDGDTALDVGKMIATGIYMSKDIVNSPHSTLNSLSLASTAKRIAEESGGSIQCKILGKKECEERGMGAYLGVARASETEPQFIHLTYTPPDRKVNKRVGVVGKGLLFDTGGYNIKTGMMELMKFDCGGAAAVLGKKQKNSSLY